MILAISVAEGRKSEASTLGVDLKKLRINSELEIGKIQEKMCVRLGAILMVKDHQSPLFDSSHLWRLTAA